MSTVIKAGNVGPLLMRLSTVDLADHLAEARQIVDAASQRAELTISDAEETGERMAVSAKESGYAAGYERGLAEGKKTGHDSAYEDSTRKFDERHANVVTQMERAIVEIHKIKENLRIKAEKDLLDFALLLATKLTFAVGRLYRESARENLVRALSLVSARTDLTIRVHPDDLASMETYAPSVLGKLDASDAVSIVADESLAPGGCLLMNDRTRVDATLETQVEELSSLLLGESSPSGGP